MICTSLQHKNLDALFEALETTEMAEIRLDRCPLSPDDIEGLFGSSDVPLVATCRIAEVLADLQRADGIPDTEKGRREQQIRAYDITERRLAKAVEAGAAYIDLEMEAPAPMSKRLRKAALENGTIVIRSYHDFTGTPSREKLAETISQCREFGAEVVKIVTTAQCEADVQTVLSLYEDFDRLIAFCMGEAGRQSRLDCLAKGAPYTYAAFTEDEATAPGQWTTASMEKALYGNWKPIACDTPLQMPCSKSFAQRAILAAALAEGTSHLSGYSPCGDNESALAVARSLGATVLPVEDAAGTLTITGIGATAGSMDLKEVHVGESGLLTRLRRKDPSGPPAEGRCGHDGIVRGPAFQRQRPQQCLQRRVCPPHGKKQPGPRQSGDFRKRRLTAHFRPADRPPAHRQELSRTCSLRWTCWGNSASASRARWKGTISSCRRRTGAIAPR